jgi:hypothetical protein
LQVLPLGNQVFSGTRRHLLANISGNLAVYLQLEGLLLLENSLGVRGLLLGKLRLELLEMVLEGVQLVLHLLALDLVLLQN